MLLNGAFVLFLKALRRKDKIPSEALEPAWAGVAPAGPTAVWAWDQFSSGLLCRIVLGRNKGLLEVPA